MGHIRLNNVSQCYDSIRKLQLTIRKNYFISDYIERSNSYNCLGVAYQLIGKRVLAEYTFGQAIKLDPASNCALQRLKMEIKNEHKR
jgi:Flp pilus assembly protein TadD